MRSAALAPQWGFAPQGATSLGVRTGQGLPCWTPRRRPSRVQMLARLEQRGEDKVSLHVPPRSFRAEEVEEAEDEDGEPLEVVSIEEALQGDDVEDVLARASEEDEEDEEGAFEERAQPSQGLAQERSRAGEGAGKQALVRSQAGPTLSAAPAAPRSSWLPTQPVLHYGAVGLGGFVAINAALILFRVGRKLSSPQHRRQRTVNKNQLVVTTLAQFLPGNRAGLSGGMLKSLRFRTGFNNVDIFRKFLWFVLRERPFDREAVDDLLALKEALQLTGAEVAAALRERAQRIYDKYGNIMLDTAGMTAAGIERKTSSRALFSKLQYLAQCEDLLSSEDAREVDLRRIFGATEEDAARLRIVSLEQIDLDKLMEGPAAEKNEPSDQEGSADEA